jgi:hypothetical protein
METAIRIVLSEGYCTELDYADVRFLEGRKWSALKASGGHIYAIGNKRGEKPILLHRLLTNAPKGMVVDHRDGKGLNNRRANLRVCTQSQNLANRPRCHDGSTRFKGVHKAHGGFRAAIMVAGLTHRLGLCTTAEEAANAYAKAAIRLRGDFEHSSTRLEKAA